MASDFGDESGEKLFDWLLRIGQDAGEKAMLESADKLATAFRKASEGIDEKEVATSDVKTWAKLDMGDFAELPSYETLREVIDGELETRGIMHEFANEAGREFLVFRTKDVHEISEVFHRLEDTVLTEKEHAQKAGILERGDTREKKPVQQQKGSQKTEPKGPDLNAPATEKQREYVDSLKSRNIISGDELEKAAGPVLTIGAANGILNRYGRFLKLDRESEPLEQRAAAAREASRALQDGKAADREIHLSQGHSK